MERLFQQAGNCFADFGVFVMLQVCQASHAPPSTPHLKLLALEERGLRGRIPTPRGPRAALPLRSTDFVERQGREGRKATLGNWRRTIECGPRKKQPESRKPPPPPHFPTASQHPATFHPRRRPAPFTHTPEFRGHVRRDLAPPHASDRPPGAPGLLASGSGPCACAPRPARGGANPVRRKGRGGARTSVAPGG